jgi:hypothetical protein
MGIAIADLVWRSTWYDPIGPVLPGPSRWQTAGNSLLALPSSTSAAVR